MHKQSTTPIRSDLSTGIDQIFFPMRAFKDEPCKCSSMLLGVEVFSFRREISRFSLLSGKYGNLLHWRFMTCCYVLLKSSNGGSDSSQRDKGSHLVREKSGGT